MENANIMGNKALEKKIIFQDNKFLTVTLANTGIYYLSLTLF